MMRRRPTTGSSSMAAQTGSIYGSGTTIDNVEIPAAKLRLSTVTSSKKVPQMILTTHSNNNNDNY